MPVYIVGTYDKSEKANIMAASWGGICNSIPPCIAVSVRESRHTYEGIELNKAFTVNIPDSMHTREADFTGTRSGKDHDKFKELGLTAIKAEAVNAPIVKEFPVSIICKLFKKVELGSHIQYIGEILDVLVNEDALDESGKPDIRKIDPILYDYVSRRYFSIGEPVMDAYQ